MEYIKKSDGTILTSSTQVILSPERSLKKVVDATKSAQYLFYGASLEYVNDLIQYDDVENAEKISYMFFQCLHLKEIPLLNTHKVKYMVSMFEHNYELTEVQLDTSNIVNMNRMFFYCHLLQSVDITKIADSYNTSAFDGCNSLTKLIIRTMDTLPTLQSSAFNQCYHFTGRVDSSYNPDGLKDGRIYVPDDKVESLKVATNWSAFADIIVPLSELEED